MKKVKFELDRKADKLVDICRREAWDEVRPHLMKTFNEIRNEALEEAAKLMEDKFHKVGRYPNYHPKYVPGDMHSPFADAIRTLALAAHKPGDTND